MRVSLLKEKPPWQLLRLHLQLSGPLRWLPLLAPHKRPLFLPPLQIVLEVGAGISHVQEDEDRCDDSCVDYSIIRDASLSASNCCF